MTNLVMRFDMRNPDFGAPTDELYKAAIDMSVWAEEKGFDTIQISEHHASEDGYLASPIVLASAIASRTSKIRLRFSVITLPFNDPLKIAEDLAVLDVISGGRVEVIFAGGYVDEEFEMFGVDPKQRGNLVEEGIIAIKQAWTGQSFEYRGRKALVRPTPVQQPHPPIWMGGSSKVAARRAGRLAEYFYTEDSALYDVFRDEAIKHGSDPGPWADIGSGFLVVADDPEQEIKRLEPYILHETNSYARWLAQGGTDGQYVEMDSAAPLVAMGLYPVLSPEQALNYARARGDDGNVCLHPLISGLPPEIAWQHLNTFSETLLPTLRP